MKKYQKFLPDFIFGSIDGLVTTFAVVSGVIGAGLPAKVILILGFANLFADGFSMGASNYVSTKSENEIGQNNKKPLNVALVTFSAFIIVGFIPLMAFVLDFGDLNFKITIILTAIAFIAVGYLKGLVTGKNKFIAATQTFFIGSLAAFIAFFVGYLISTFTN